MRRSVSLGFLFLLLSGVSLPAARTYAAPPTPAEIDTARIAAIGSLAVQQWGDGSYRDGDDSGIRLSGAVAEAYLNAGLGGGVLPDSTIVFLQGAPAGSVDALARQHAALRRAGRSTTALSQELNARRNAGFAWGAYRGYDSSIPDTPLATLALLDSGDFDLTNARSTLCNGLLYAQRPDGSFSYTVNGFATPASQSSGAVIPTAYAAHAVRRLRLATGFVSLSCQRLEDNMFVSTSFDLNTVVSDATTWLLAQQNSTDGGFGTGAVSSALETAISYQALSDIDAVAYQAQLGEAQGYLVNQQLSDGSWNGDAFTTALALATLPTLSPGTLADSDGDGMPDDVETTLGTDPLIADRSSSPGNGIGSAGNEFSIVLTVGTQYEPYSVALDSFPGTPSFSWSIESGFVPDGLSLDPMTGELAGVPSVAGLFNFAYRIEDSQNDSQRVNAQISILTAAGTPVPGLAPAARLLLVLLLGAVALLHRDRSGSGNPQRSGRERSPRLREKISSLLRGTLGLGLLLAIGGATGPVRSAQAAPNVEPVSDAVVERLLARQPVVPDRLVKRMREEVAETQRLLSALSVAPAAGGRRGAGSVSAPHMLLASKVAQMDVFGDELRRRFAEARERLARHAANEQIERLNELETRVSERIASFSTSLNAVLTAESPSARGAARRAALQQLAKLAGEPDVSARTLDTLKPTLRSDSPQPRRQFAPSRSLPRYLTGPTASAAQAAQAAAPLAAAAAAPPLPSESASCGTPTELASALAESEEIQLTPEILGLAESLGFSPARLFEYVQQNVAFEPYYGSLKGAEGTLLAGSGGATDQASLLIALLRASNVPARYVKGQVLVDDAVSDPPNSRVAKWLGARSYAGAAARLQQGQNPQVFTLNNSSAEPIGVSLIHVWVETCVPYGNYRGSGQDNSDFRWIPLDTSFKEFDYQQGIDTSVAFDYPTYLAQRTPTLPDEYYADQVLNAVRAPGIPPFGSHNILSDIFYSGSLVPFTVDVLPASLPFKVVQFQDWAGLASPEADEVPDSHRHKLTIRFRDDLGTSLIDETLSLPEVALARLTLGFEGATPADETTLQSWQSDGTLPSGAPTPLPCVVNVVPVLRGLVAGIEGQVIASGTPTNPLGICTNDHQLDMEVSVSELLNPVINSITFTDIEAATLNALQAYAYETSDRLLNDRAARLLETVRNTADPNTALDETEGEFLHLVGLKYMRADADGSKRIAGLRGGSGDRGPSLGRTAAQAKVDYVFDIPFAVARNGYFIDIPGGRSRNADLTTGDLDWATFLLTGYHGSALEHHVWQENIRLDAVSTVRGLQFAHENGIASVTADSANWATVTGGFTTNPGCTIDSTLNYPQCILDSIKANYVDSGFTLTLPESLIQYGDWKGYVFVGELDNTGTGQLSQAAFIIGQISGGYTLRPLGDTGIDGVPQTTYDPTNDAGYVTPDPDSQYSVTPPPGEPIQPLITNPGPLSNGIDRRYMLMSKGVNVATGNFGNAEIDIDIPGRGELPLVFKRFYNSRNPVDGPLGFGWTHNFNQFLHFSDNNADNASDPGDSDGSTSSVAWHNSSGGEKLFQVTGDPSGVAIGSPFTRLPGTHADVSRNPDGTYSVREQNGLTFHFESVAGLPGETARLVSVEDRNANGLTLTYDSSCGDNLCSVADDLGRSITFSYDVNDRITQISDFSGRLFQYQYNDGQGNLTDYLSPLAVAGMHPPAQYEYFQPADGTYLNHALKRHTNSRGGSTRNEYYANGKLFRVTDARGSQRTFLYNDFRRESVELGERGFRKTFKFDQYGNTVRIIKENGARIEQVFDVATPDRVYDKLAVISPEGYSTQYTYDGNGNLTSTTRPSGATILFSNIGPTAQPGKLIDANGNTTLLTYDGRGNLLSQIVLTREYCTSHDCSSVDPASYVPAPGDMVSWSVFGYDAFGNNTGFKQVRNFAAQVADDTITSETGPRLVYTYDVDGLYPTEVARTGRFNGEPVATTQSAPLVYDSLGRLTTGIDDHWYPTTFRYDDLGRVIEGTDALGVQRLYSYDASGNRTGERILDGSRVAFSQSAGFDALDRQTSRTDTGGNVTHYVYDAVGNLVRATDPDGSTQRFAYDAVNFPIRYYDALENVASRTYDESGRPRSATDPNGNTTFFDFYDATGDGRLESFTNPGNRTTRFVYDSNGNAIETSVTGSDQISTRTTKRFFDEQNRPERLIGPTFDDPVLGTVRRVAVLTYDSLGNVVSVEAGHTPDLTGDDPLQDVLAPRSSSVFDDFGRRIQESDGLVRSWTYTYDTHDQLVQVVDPKSQTTTLTWQRGGLLVTRIDDDGGRFDYSHNLLGQVTRVSGPAVTYDYAYDDSLRLSRTTDSRGGKRLDYAYSPGGRLDRLSDNNGNVVDYRYDAKGRVTGVWAPNFDFVGFTYDPGGRLKTRFMLNGLSVDYQYNPDGTVQEVLNRFGPDSVSQHIYGYDPFGNRNSHVETIGGTTIAYAYQYDDLDRLIQTDNGNPAELESYTYDVFGNRTSLTRGAATTAYVYDAADQLSESRDGSVTGPLLASFSYDANGNLTGRSDTGAAYTYDALDRLVQVSQPGIPTEAYTYDGQGRRIRKQIGAAEQNFVYDGLNQVSEFDATWAAPNEFLTYGPTIDQPLIRESGTGSQFFYQDGLSTAVATVDDLGSVLGTQRFDAWGNAVDSTGNVGSIGFTGRTNDATGLIYYRARYYDPTTGRFNQRDALGLAAGLNPYAYANNNPILFNDPTGNCPACAGALVGAVAGVLFQAGADLISGELSSFSQYAGAAVGGAAGGAAALTCGPACAGAAAGAAASAVTQGIDAFNGDTDFGSASGVLEGVTNLAIDTAVGAATGGLLNKLTPAMKANVSSQLKGNIGEALTNLRILLSGKIPTTQVPNGVGKSTFDFAIGDPALRNFIEAKFGTAGLSAIQKLARDLPGTSLTVDKWTYEVFWGIVAAGPAGAFSGEFDLDTLLGLLGGGYTVGDVFAPTR